MRSLTHIGGRGSPTRASGRKAGGIKAPLRKLPATESIALLDDFPMLVWRSGPDARCDYFNKAWLEFTGRSLEQELGNGWAEGVHPDDRERCVKHYLDAFKARRPFVLEYRLRHRGGEYRWIRDFGQPYTDGGGHFAGYIGGCFDLSESRLADEARRQSEQRLAGILNSQETFVSRVDRQGRITYMNSTFSRAFGAEIGDLNWSSVHPDDVASTAPLFAKVYAPPYRCTLEVRNRIRGEWRWVQWENSAIRDASGQIVEIQGIGFDVTERRRNEDVLKLQSAAAIAISGAPDFRTALESVVRLTCELTGWAIGEAWLPSADDSRLEWSTAFHSSMAGTEAFVATSRKATVAPNQYFVGKVWKTGEPSWRGEHLATSERVLSIPGRPQAQCAIPVLADGNVVAVLSFFSQSQRPHDQRLLDAITGIAAQLGMLLKRKQAEEGLRFSEQQLRQAFVERERLSRDLHDGITQDIYAIGMALEEAQRSASTNPDAATRRISAAIAGLNKVIRDMRGHIAGTAPSTAGRPQLGARLQTLARTLDGTHQLRFRVRVDRKAASGLSFGVSDQVFNIVREAMSNSVRHSAGRRGLVSLQPTRAGVRVLIEDDGKGFNPRRTRSSGQGLRNIEARARELSARLEVRSKPGSGTRIVLDIPAEALRALA